MNGYELHKIGQRDMKIPISKIGRRAWQNRTDSKNWTDFGFLCKQGVSENKCWHSTIVYIFKSVLFFCYVAITILNNECYQLHLSVLITN
jgi:hypothetical protein